MSPVRNTNKRIVSRWAIGYIFNPLTISIPVCFVIARIVQILNNSSPVTCSIYEKLSNFYNDRIIIGDCSIIVFCFWAITAGVLPVQIVMLKRMFDRQNVMSALMGIAAENVLSGRWRSLSQRYFLGMAILGVILAVLIPVIPNEDPIPIDHDIVLSIIVFISRNWLCLQFLIIFVVLMFSYKTIIEEVK